jgi:hypothetical protein
LADDFEYQAVEAELAIAAAVLTAIALNLIHCSRYWT